MQCWMWCYASLSPYFLLLLFFLFFSYNLYFPGGRHAILFTPKNYIRIIIRKPGHWKEEIAWYAYMMMTTLRELQVKLVLNLGQCYVYSIPLVFSPKKRTFHFIKSKNVNKSGEKLQLSLFQSMYVLFVEEVGEKKKERKYYSVCSRLFVLCWNSFTLSHTMP